MTPIEMVAELGQRQENPGTFRERYIQAEKETARLGQELLQVHALIHRARLEGETAVPVDDLVNAVGELDQPNSVVEWGRQGKLSELIRTLADLNRRRRDGENI